MGAGFLAGQTALVTGANSGIGEAVARALAAAGAAVAVNYVARPEEAERVVSGLRAAGAEAIALRADVGDEAEVGAMFRQLFENWGTLHILVNNAGIQQDAPVAHMTLEQWDRVLAVNLTGAFLCSREAVREFLRRGPVPEVSRATGKILFVSSVHEVIPWAGHANYAASKGGVMMLMKSLAQEVAADGIRVNSVCPGAVKTPINTAAWATPEAEAELLRLVPFGRVGDPADIGKAAAWLVSDEADYVTGTSLFVDGGMTLYPGFRTGG